MLFMVPSFRWGKARERRSIKDRTDRRDRGPHGDQPGRSRVSPGTGRGCPRGCPMGAQRVSELVVADPVASDPAIDLAAIPLEMLGRRAHAAEPLEHVEELVARG